MSGPIWRREKIYTLNWDEFSKCICLLAAGIRKSGFEADRVVGIARGGLVPAVALASILSIRSFGVLSVSRNRGDDKFSAREATACEQWSAPNTLRGERVLLVDDIAGDGGTLALAERMLTKREVAAIRSVVLVRNEGCMKDVDHFALSADDWVVFPWERDPDVGLLPVVARAAPTRE